MHLEGQGTHTGMVLIFHLLYSVQLHFKTNCKPFAYTNATEIDGPL